MKVILLKTVPKIGRKDEVVEVAQGFAQNALFPSKSAIAATPAALEALKRKQQNVSAEKAIRQNLLDVAIKALGDAHLTLHVKTNEQGNLFSKIHESDIANYLAKEHHLSIDPSCIILADGPIKKVGIYAITIKDEDYSATVTVEITQ